MIKQFIKTVMLVFFALFMVSAIASFEKKASSSLANHPHALKAKDPVDSGWLPDLNGLPDKDQLDLLTANMVNVMMEDPDEKCTSINLHLRMMVFQHFVVYQHMANAQNIYFDEKTAHHWAHVLAMILKESSGDSTNITDMKGHSISTAKPQTNLQHWRKILSLSEQNRIKLNYQTNFGLTQTSADRLFVTFHLAKNQKKNTAFLEGKEGALTPGKVELNTAIAIRRFIWFYQDFAQGRISQQDSRIHQEDIGLPEVSARYKAGLERVVLYCGTRFMFRKEDPNSEEKEFPKLEKAIASIAYCKLGNPHTGYGVNEFDEICFAKWVTLCPALNIDIATLTPLSYFATRHAIPVCEGTFKRLLIKKPGSI